MMWTMYCLYIIYLLIAAFWLLVKILVGLWLEDHDQQP